MRVLRIDTEVVSCRADDIQPASCCNVRGLPGLHMRVLTKHDECEIIKLPECEKGKSVRMLNLHTGNMRVVQTGHVCYPVDAEVRWSAAEDC